MLDAMTRVDGGSAWLRAQVEDVLTELLPDDGAGDATLDRSAVTLLLRGAFELPQRGDRPVTGAVTVCGLEPMRSVPFRVIAHVRNHDDAEVAVGAGVYERFNASAVVLRGSDLDALSDNPDDLLVDLQALAGPAAGPNGGSIFIDGFSGGEVLVGNRDERAFLGEEAGGGPADTGGAPGDNDTASGQTCHDVSSVVGIQEPLL